MRSILYPDGNFPKPFYSNSRDNVYSLIIISLIFILAIFSYFFYLFRTTQQYDNFLTTCPAGYCATSLETGNKRCPLSLSQKIYINPGSEVCNPSNLCTNTLTPYAVLSDGSVNIDGICDLQICSCVKTRKCPNYASVIFTETGKLYSQTAIGTTSTGGTQTNIDFNQTCLIDPSNFSKLGCTSNMTALQCVQTNPCTIGVLSYIPDKNISPIQFVASPSNFNLAITACIPGPICKNSEVSVFNNVTNIAECVVLPVA